MNKIYPSKLLFFPTTNTDKYLVCFPFYTKDNVARYFSELKRAHAAATLVINSNIEIHPRVVGGGHQLFQTLTFQHSQGHLCVFPRYKGLVDLDGVDYLGTLLEHTAPGRTHETSLLDHVTTDGAGALVPVVLDFERWHSVCYSNGYFRGDPEQLWVRMFARKLVGDYRAEVLLPENFRTSPGPNPRLAETRPIMLKYALYALSDRRALGFDDVPLRVDVQGFYLSSFIQVYEDELNS